MFIFLIIVKVDNWFQFTPTWMNFLNRVRKFIHNCSHGFFCCFGPKQSIHVYEVSIFCKFLESHPAMSTFATSPTAFNTVRSNIKPSVLSPSLPKPPPPESSVFMLSPKWWLSFSPPQIIDIPRISDVQYWMLLFLFLFRNRISFKWSQLVM